MTVPAAVNETSRLDFSRASMLVQETQNTSLAIVRDMARGMGFQRIRDTPDLEHAVRLIEHFEYELLVLGADGQLERVCEVVRGIRRGELGNNPFAVIILTCAQVSEGDAAALINSGADTVIFKPFSNEQFYQRLHALVRGRKMFVATPQYIGPDRRDASREEPNGPRPIDVPNALACSVDDTILDLQAAIGEARQALAMQQAARLILEMKAAIDRVCTAATAGDLSAATCRDAAATLGKSVDAVTEHIRKGAHSDLEPLLKPAEQAVSFLAKAGESDGATLKTLVDRLARLTG